MNQSMLLLGGLLMGVSALLYRDRCKRLERVIRRHDLCHNLDGSVSAEQFAEGCAAHQRQLYGRAPHADLVNTANDVLFKLMGGEDAPGGARRLGTPETGDHTSPQDDVQPGEDRSPTTRRGGQDKAPAKKAGPPPSKSGKSRRTMHD